MITGTRGNGSPSRHSYPPSTARESTPAAGSSWQWQHLQSEVERLGGRSRRQRAAVGLLVLALIGASAYGYLTLRKHNLQLGELPGLRESTTLASERLNAAEQQLQAWAANWDGFETRLAKLEKGFSSLRGAARKEAQGLVAQLHRRTQTELDERAQVLESRLATVAADQEQQRTQMNQLREEIADVRAEAGRELDLLHQRASRDEQNLSGLAQSVQQRLRPRRLDFELAEDYSRELVGGITLRVSDTDVSFQRVKGWIWLLPDRKTIWVRGLGVQQPLIFYRNNGTERNELVITRVTRDGATGYLLLPNTPEGGYAGSADSN